MNVWTSLSEWREHRRTLEGRSAGFVPTMGALHAGHMSLVRRARAEIDVVMASIFVNPSQFNDPSDLARYPKTLDQDLALLEQYGTDEVLVPDAREMYPQGYRLRVDTNEPAPIMEAAYRPGFLAGVLTVVLKLFQLVRPTRAYFGEKDYQQLKVVEEMVQEFFLPIEIIPCPTIREASGLAQSSRNALLSPEGREKASAIYKAISSAGTPESARAALMAEGFQVDYVEDHWQRRFAAARLENVRLIDNIRNT